MLYHIHFSLDGLRGRETFRSEQPSLAGFDDAYAQFWALVAELGARRIVPPESAWQPVTFVDGPKLLAVERVTAL